MIQNNIVELNLKMFDSHALSDDTHDDTFSNKLIGAIQSKITDYFQLFGAKLNIARVQDIKEIYQQLNIDLKPRNRNLSHDYMRDHITNYTQLNRELKLNNVYTPYTSSEKQGVEIRMVHDTDPDARGNAAFWQLSVIANRQMYRQTNTTGETTLSMYVTVPLIIDQNILTTVWEAQIVVPENMLIDSNHYITDEQANHLTIHTQLVLEAGMHGIINIVSSPSADPQKVIACYQKFISIPDQQQYISHTLANLSAQKIKALYMHGKQQYVDAAENYCRTNALRAIMAAVPANYSIVTLDGQQQNTLQSLLAASVNASVVKQQLHQINGRLATSEDVLSFIRKEKKQLPLTKARYLLNNSQEFISPFDATDRDMQAQSSKLLAPISDDTDNFHQSLLLPANHRQYTSPFVSMTSQVLVIDNKIIASLWGCITDNQYSWLAPFLINVEIEHRETKDIIHPFVLAQPELSLCQTKAHQSAKSQQSLQVVRYHLKKLFASLNYTQQQRQQQQIKPIVIRRKSYRQKLSEFF